MYLGRDLSMRNAPHGICLLSTNNKASPATAHSIQF